jgi:hypothetical protein
VLNPKSLTVAASVVVVTVGLFLSGVGTASARLTITTPALHDLIATKSVTESLRAIGGTRPYHWSVSKGNLPPGLSLSSDGVITGTPTNAGTSVVTIRAVDSSDPFEVSTHTYSVTVDLEVAISPQWLIHPIVGHSYQSTLTAAGGKAPYHFTVAVGSLPPGLTLTPAGVLSGTLKRPTMDAFTVKVTDGENPTRIGTKRLTLVTALDVGPPYLPLASVSLPYRATLIASEGKAPFHFAKSAGSLPPGLSLSSTGVISGTPTSTTIVTFSVEVTDSSKPVHIGRAKYTLATAVEISTPSLPALVMSRPYTATLSAVGGTAPYHWSVQSGGLPSGLSLSSAGVISGTPTSSVTATFTVKVTDSSHRVRSGTKRFTIARTVAILPATLPVATVSTPYSAMLSAVGGTAPYHWSVQSGGLPSGLSLSSAGVISGTPTSSVAATFTVKVIDSAKTARTATKKYTLAYKMEILPATLPVATVSTPYSAMLSAVGGTAPYHWSVQSGSLPSGLSLSSAGVISGTPTSSVAATFTVKVIDSAKTARIATKKYTITFGRGRRP